MSTETQPLITTPTKCKLCGHIFPVDSLRDAVILGASPQAKLQQIDALMKPLMKHLQKAHPDAIEQSQFAGATFAGYLTMINLDIDAETQKKLGMDLTRWKIRQMMTRQETRVSDERLEERLTAVLDKHVSTGVGSVFDKRSTVHPELRNDLMLLLKQLRDAIEERGRYIEQT
jgi:hypothetical protein